MILITLLKKKIDRINPSKNLIKFLHTQKKFHEFYISTGTPQNKIIEILKKKKIFKYFKKIYGSPLSKFHHIKKIKKKNQKILFVGDSFEDFNLAIKTNINFLLKINSENLFFRNKYKIKKIQSFKYLNNYIKKIFEK